MIEKIKTIVHPKIVNKPIIKKETHFEDYGEEAYGVQKLNEVRRKVQNIPPPGASKPTIDYQPKPIDKRPEPRKVVEIIEKPMVMKKEELKIEAHYEEYGDEMYDANRIIEVKKKVKSQAPPPNIQKTTAENKAEARLIEDERSYV